jgi:hypothetical protein
VNTLLLSAAACEAHCQRCGNRVGNLKCFPWFPSTARHVRSPLPGSLSLGPPFPTFFVTQVDYDFYFSVSTTFGCPSPADTLKETFLYRIPLPVYLPRRKVDLPGSRVPPVRTCPVLRPRRFPHTTPARRVGCCLPDAPSPRLNRDCTHFEAPEPQPVRSILPVPHPGSLQRTRDSLLPCQRALGRWDFLPVIR